jgi:hypothetical protein
MTYKQNYKYGLKWDKVHLNWNWVNTYLKKDYVKFLILCIFRDVGKTTTGLANIICECVSHGTEFGYIVPREKDLKELDNSTFDKVNKALNEYYNTGIKFVLERGYFWQVTDLHIQGTDEINPRKLAKYAPKVEKGKSKISNGVFYKRIGQVVILGQSKSGKRNSGKYDNIEYMVMDEVLTEKGDVSKGIDFSLCFDTLYNSVEKNYDKDGKSKVKWVFFTNPTTFDDPFWDYMGIPYNPMLAVQYNKKKGVVVLSREPYVSNLLKILEKKYDNVYDNNKKDSLYVAYLLGQKSLDSFEYVKQYSDKKLNKPASTSVIYDSKNYVQYDVYIVKGTNEFHIKAKNTEKRPSGSHINYNGTRVSVVSNRQTSLINTLLCAMGERPTASGNQFLITFDSVKASRLYNLICGEGATTSM